MSRQPDSDAMTFENWRESQRMIDRVRVLESQLQSYMRMHLELTAQIRTLEARIDDLEEQENACQ